MNTNKSFYAPEIDGLRAIAVVAVIINHLNHHWLASGFAGVDVFFIISGFVVSSASSGIRDLGFNRFLMRFYARRLVRITPALFICLIVSSYLAALFIPPAYLSRSIFQTGQWAALGVSNFALAFNSDGYFSALAEFNPFTHTWSLGVEEQFYLIFPFIFILWIESKRKISVGAVLILALVSFIVCVYLTSFQSIYAFYMIWSRFWELAVGVLIYQVMVLMGHSFNKPTLSTKVTRLGGKISLIVLLIGLMQSRFIGTPLPSALFAVVGTAGLLLSLHGRSDDRLVQLLSKPIIVFIGRISYSLYLWHWVVLVIFRWTVGADDVISYFGIIITTIIFSLFSYYLIETPIRRRGGIWPVPYAIVFGISLIILGYFSIVSIEALRHKISLSVVTTHPEDWFPTPKVDKDGCRVEQTHHQKNNDIATTYEPVNCPYKKENRIFVLGDSHAMGYLRMLISLASKTGVSIITYDKLGCAVFSFLPEENSPRGDKCRARFVTDFKDLLNRAKKDDIVFLPSLRLPRLCDQWIYFGWAYARSVIHSEEGRKAREHGRRVMLEMLPKLVEKGVHVVFEAPTPLFEVVPYRCSDFFNQSNPACRYQKFTDRSQFEELRAPVVHEMKWLSSHIDKVHMWDPLPVLCPGKRCETTKDDRPLFYDGDHISGFANDLLLPSFMQFLEGIS